MRGELKIFPPSVRNPEVMDWTVRDLRDAARFWAIQASEYRYWAQSKMKTSEERHRLLEWASRYWGAALAYWRLMRMARKGQDWVRYCQVRWRRRAV